MIRYAITSGTYGSTDEVIAHARRWASEGVAYVQLRERHLSAGEQVRLATAMLASFRELGSETRLLVNHRVDVAHAAGCGVHLTSHPGELTALQVRQVFGASETRQALVVSKSCHTLEDVRRAAADGADLILFGPVFEKRAAGELVVPGVGLEMLREACAVAGSTPVLALGGVTIAKAGQCVEADAAGIAGIRTFA